MQSQEQVTKQVDIALKRIDKLLDKQSLENFFKNVERFDGIDEMQREDLIQAIEDRLRQVSPRSATKNFGPKDSKGREFLDEVFNALSLEIDLSDNKVKNGVKTSGEMIAGREHVAIYVSYKNQANWHVGLAWIQDSPNMDPYLKVTKYQHNISNSTKLPKDKFEMSEKEAAVEEFKKLVRTLIN